MAGRGGREITCSAAEMAEVFTLAALNNGSMVKAHKALTEIRKGTGLNTWTPETFRAWRRREPELYERTAKAVTEQLRRNAAEKHMEAAATALEIEDEIGKRLKDRVENLPDRDLPGALRNAATAGAIHVDKALALLGDTPAGVSVTVNLGETVRGLKAQGARFYDSEGKEISPDQIIEGQATEIPEKTEAA